MKTKRKLKGMTLMEVVVSLAVYAVIGLLIAEIMTLVNATMKATNQLNRRLSYEAKFADNLLYSDGVSSFKQDGVTLTMRDAAGTFNITTPGSVFQTNADNMEHTENNLIINGNTNYRFLVFTRGASATPTPITVFYVDLNLGTTDSNWSDNPITKIIVEGTGVPGYGGAYAFGTESGPIYQKQVLTESHPADFDVTGANPIAVTYTGMESLVSGGRILRIAVPAADGDGNAIMPDPTNPSAAHDPVKGNLVVKIYRSIQDQSHNKYNWYTDADVALIRRAYPDPTNAALDAHGFPAVATLTLDFVLSAENPNTQERSFFSGVTYVWNPNIDPNDQNYLVAQTSVGTR